MSQPFTKTPIEPLPPETNATAHKIVDAAFAVHKNLGPGLLESVYEVCLVHELIKRGLAVKQQLAVPILYDNIRLDGGLRLDLLVEDRVIVELKTVDLVLPVHKAQVLTYLKLTGHRLALLINFNAHLIKNGIFRIIL
ncbi:MAG: GxxExxY protein [Anaerolineales bacterium]|nr:GxxExxY protein [Anaerolineales bacterium]